MKKALGVLFFTLFFSAALFAQRQLVIKIGAKDSYLEHKVAKGENYFSIGRAYYVNPKFLAAYNSMDFYKGLPAGKLIQIPLTDSNFSRVTNKGKPVYYIVQNEESLEQVGSVNKIATKTLRTWNKLNGENVSKGQKLIVGYLVPAQAKKTTTVKNQNPVVEPKTDSKDIAANKEDNKIKDTNKSSQQTANTTVEPIVEVKKPEEKTESQQAVEKSNPDHGFFKHAFEQQVKQKSAGKHQTVTSGIFKSGSGWNDAKYYLLVDEVEPGTIVRITNPSNNKFIYAKVLGDMKGSAQSAGIDIRISNAAASILQVDDTDKFILKLNY